jgi:hypothetical protein
MDDCRDCAAETFLVREYLKKFRMQNPKYSDIIKEINLISKLMSPTNYIKTVYQPPHGYRISTPMEQKVEEIQKLATVAHHRRIMSRTLVT